MKHTKNTNQAGLELNLSDLLAKTPRMADGTPIFLGDEIWCAQCGHYKYPYTRAVKQKVETLSIADSSTDYNGDFVVCCESWEGGNLDCFRTAEEVLGVDE